MSHIEPFIAYGRQHIDQSDVDAVVAVLTSDWLTQGPAIERFEAALVAATESTYAVAVSSATAALHIACLALDVGPGDLVWTSPNSFVASANCALYCGAEVDFVDIDPVSLNMSLALLTEKLAAAKALGRLPKVVIPVHFGGESCDMAEISALARQYGVRVIEDASHAVGASYGARKVGSCEFSDITVFSFHPVKIITTAEGGAAMTNNPVIAARLDQLRTHGITRDAGQMDRASDGPWYYQQISLGYNYRMTDMQAALGVSQLARLDQFVAARHRIADRYDAMLADLPLTLPSRKTGRFSALHLYPVQVHQPSKRLGLFNALRAANIGVNVHYIPIHLQPYYRHLGFHTGDFPAAEHYYTGAISLPMHPQLTPKDLDRVVAVLREELR